MTSEQKIKVSAAVEIITRVAVGLTLAGVMWLATSVSTQGSEIAVVKERVNQIASRLEGFDGLNARLAKIEANRFTSEDGLELWKELATLKERIPSEIPPAWFLEKVKVVEERLKALEHDK